MEQVLPFNQLSQRDKRSLIFQLLYSAETTDYEISLPILLANYYRAFNYDIPCESDLVAQVQWVIQDREELDQIYAPLLSNWRFDRISIATRIILRYAIWEFLHTDLQTTVIINEAVELAKAFAERDAYKFINGILDEVAKRRDRTDNEPASVNQS